MKNERINRIKQMEQNFDIAQSALNDFEKSLEAFLDAQSKIIELSDYYFSKQWLEDYDADCRGDIPSDLKRGVLSEDGAYNLISRYNELLNKFK